MYSFPHKADFWVEANLNEVSTLWLLHAQDARRFCPADPRGPRIPWGQNRSGVMVTIGHLNNRPVYVSFDYFEIGVGLVCFYNPTSELVDYKMIEEWMLANCPGFRDHHCDANNFHLCCSAVT